MNVTESKFGSFIKKCPMNEIVWRQEYHAQGKFCLSHGSNNPEHTKLSCDDPDEMAVETRPRLQSKYNVLLACLAGTDLLAGTALQPSFIAGQIYVTKGLSLIEYCRVSIP